MPLRVDLGPNLKHKFTTLEDVLEWVKRERQAWAWLDGQTQTQRNQVSFNLFNAAWSGLEQAVEQGEEREVEDQFEKHFGFEGQALYSGSAAGCYLLRIAEKDPRLANGVAILLTGNQLARQGTRDTDYGASVLAWAGFEQSKTGVDASFESLRTKGRKVASELDQIKLEADDVLVSLSNDAKTGLLDAARSFEEQHKKTKEELRELLKTGKQTYEESRSFYETELALKAPATYWNGVAKHNQYWSRIWGITLAGLFAVIVAALLKWASSIVTFLSGKDKDAASVVLAIAVATIVFWALRVVARIFLSNYQRAVDAAERETMIKTFLALRKEGNITDGQLEVVLLPIFRPGATGIVKDDSAPEYGLAALLSRDR